MTTTPPAGQQLADIRARFEASTHPNWRDATDVGLLLAELDRVRARAETIQVGALEREVLLTEARDLLEPHGGHGDNWPAIAPAISTLLQKLADAEAELGRLTAENTELATELGARDEKARKRWIKNQEKQLGINYADFRAGRWEMDLAMGREMAAAYVAMAKTMLGDAPNYSETKLEFDVKIVESPETYTLVVQRHAPGALTPHEARQRAEAELGRARSELADARAAQPGDLLAAAEAIHAVLHDLIVTDANPGARARAAWTALDTALIAARPAAVPSA